jgi:predicted dehydrogenase
MHRTYDIIGCGAVIHEFHAPVLRHLSGVGSVSIRACIDSNAGTARRTAALLGASTSGTPDEAGHLGPADAVIVATPPESHAKIARRYLAAGKHVFLEKPFVVRAAEADELVRLADSSGVKLLVNHFRRVFPSVQIARRFIASGRLGQVRRVEATEGGRWGWPTSSDYIVRSPYGGVLLDTGSHLLDMVLFLLGLGEGRSDASFTVKTVRKSPDHEPSHEYAAELQIVSSAQGQLDVALQLSRREPLASAIKIYADSAALIIPATLSETPILRTPAGDFVLGDPPTQARPTWIVPCFLATHLEFLRAQANPAAQSPLDARNFLLLTAILESLGEHEGTR